MTNELMIKHIVCRSRTEIWLLHRHNNGSLWDIFHAVKYVFIILCVEVLLCNIHV